MGARAALMQVDKKGIEHPVSYFVQSTSGELFYNRKRGFLALLLALQYFDVYLNTTLYPVIIYTDHNPLVFVNKMKNSNQQLLRWSMLYQQYNMKIHHICGRDNVIADTLSRV